MPGGGAFILHRVQCTDKANGKISASSTGFIADISKADTSVTAPMTCAVKNYVETKINGTVTGLTSAGCCSGTSGYICCVTQNNGTISVGAATFTPDLISNGTTAVPPTSGAVNAYISCCFTARTFNSTCSAAGYLYNVGQTNGCVNYQYQSFASSVSADNVSAPSSVAVYNYAVYSLSKIPSTADTPDKIGWSKGPNTSCIDLSKAESGKFGVVKTGNNICNSSGVISVCPIRINYGSSGTAGGSYIAPGGEFTLHCIARDGVTVNTNGSGNAVTSISISGGKDITLCKETSFAKAYLSDNCVEYADKASAYSGGGVGSDTKGIYIDSATGKPKEMQFILGKSVPSNTCLFTGLGTGLTEDFGRLCLSFANEISCNSTLPVTAKLVYEYVNARISAVFNR